MGNLIDNETFMQLASHECRRQGFSCRRSAAAPHSGCGLAEFSAEQTHRCHGVSFFDEFGPRSLDFSRRTDRGLGRVPLYWPALVVQGKEVMMPQAPVITSRWDRHRDPIPFRSAQRPAPHMVNCSRCGRGRRAAPRASIIAAPRC